MRGCACGVRGCQCQREHTGSAHRPARADASGPGHHGWLMVRRWRESCKVHELGLDVFVWSADSTNTWCYQQPGGPRVSADRRLFLGPPARATPHATRHAPRATHRAPCRRTSCGQRPRRRNGKNTAGHRAKSNAKSTGSIAPRATRTRRHRAKSTADGVTRTMPPVRHGPDAPDRRQPSFDSRLHRQQAIDSRLHRQQAPSTAGSIDSRLRRHPADQLAADMSRYRLRCRLRRGRTFSGRGGGCAWWLRLVAAPVAPTGLVSVSTRGSLRSGAACKGATRATVRAA